jgi:hypothetical protein
MATRPVFVASNSADSPPGAKQILVDFDWHPGFSVSQKQKSIASLHSAIVGTTDVQCPLEISSKSPNPTGVSLSAFNLELQFCQGAPIQASVETLYQGSKIYSGVARRDDDRYSLSPREARSRARDYEAAQKLTGWTIGDYRFGLDSGTEFYDWLYLGALHQNKGLLGALMNYDCFTDIEFNPKKSLACQARSAAIARAVVLKHGSLLPYLKALSVSKQSSSSTAVKSTGDRDQCIQICLDV